MVASLEPGLHQLLALPLHLQPPVPDLPRLALYHLQSGQVLSKQLRHLSQPGRSLHQILPTESVYIFHP